MVIQLDAIRPVARALSADLEDGLHLGNRGSGKRRISACRLCAGDLVASVSTSAKRQPSGRRASQGSADECPQPPLHRAGKKHDPGEEPKPIMLAAELIAGEIELLGWELSYESRGPCATRGKIRARSKRQVKGGAGCWTFARSIFPPIWA